MEDPLVSRRDIPGYDENWLDTYRELLRKGTNKDLVDILDLQEINKNINAIKNLVWRGKRKPEKAFNFIVRLIIAKIYDEMITEQGGEYRFQVRPDDKENLSRFVGRINEIYQNAQHQLAGIPLQEAKKDDILIVEYEKGGPVKIEPQILYDIVKLLQRFRLRSERNRIDVLGEFFERFIWTEYAQSSGQFFTHPNLVRFAINMLELPSKFLKLLDNNIIPLLIDPSCGSGTFLVEAMKALSENKECKERLMNITPPGQHWAQELLYGIDTERDLVLTAKTNMIMHGDGSGNIIEADALVDFKEIPQLVKKLGEGYLKDRSAESTLITKKEFPVFSFVLSNPPFSLPLGEIDKKALSENFVLSEHYGAKKKSKNSEVFFVERWYQLLREGGEIGVVLPESAFDTPEYLPLRIFLLTRFKIEAIVALPEHAFAPFALQRTNLLFATKRPSEETRALLSFWSNSKYPQEALKNLLTAFPEENYPFFVAKARHIGYLRSKKIYREIPQNDLSRISDDYHSWKKEKIANIGKVVWVKDIAETEDLRMDVKFLSRNRTGTPFSDLFELVEPQYCFGEIDSLEPSYSVHYVETGNITSRGEISYSEFKAFEIAVEGEVSEEKGTSLSNYERLLNKIRKGLVVKFPPDTIVVSPARTYQGKMAIIDSHASKLYYSPDFIALKPKGQKDIFSAYLILRNSRTVADLDNISRIGKSGYPKLRPEDLRYLMITDEALRDGEDQEKVKALKEFISMRGRLLKQLDDLFGSASSSSPDL